MLGQTVPLCWNLKLVLLPRLQPLCWTDLNTKSSGCVSAPFPSAKWVQQLLIDENNLLKSLFLSTWFCQHAALNWCFAFTVEDLLRLHIKTLASAQTYKKISLSGLLMTQSLLRLWYKPILKWHNLCEAAVPIHLHYMLSLSTIKPPSSSNFPPAAVCRATVEMKFGRSDVEALCEREWEIEELHAALFRETISCIKPDCAAVGQLQAQERAEGTQDGGRWEWRSSSYCSSSTLLPPLESNL